MHILEVRWKNNWNVEGIIANERDMECTKLDLVCTRSATVELESAHSVQIKLHRSNPSTKRV